MSTPLPSDLSARFGDAIGVASDGAWELVVTPDGLAGALQFLGLEREPAFDYFINIAGVDFADHIEVIYQISRVMTDELVRVRTSVPRRGGTVPTATAIWAGAAWPERELMELFGVVVEGHPDPRNLLLPAGWKGFPLLKDYVYPSDHPYLVRDPLREDPGKALKG